MLMFPGGYRFGTEWGALGWLVVVMGLMAVFLGAYVP
jgi:hypothetical protein